MVMACPEVLAGLEVILLVAPTKGRLGCFKRGSRRRIEAKGGNTIILPNPMCWQSLAAGGLQREPKRELVPFEVAHQLVVIWT